MFDKNNLQTLPKRSGVYLMKDRASRIIYIGKAKDLRARVRSYFGTEEQLTPKTRLLVRNIEKIDWILTESEKEAFLLECQLIKQHHPKYNISLRDDKSYPYLRVSTQERFPSIEVIRRPRPDGALYLGPYSSAQALRETKRVMQKVFNIRDCSRSKFSNRTRPCLNYDLSLCSAPCVHFIDEVGYRRSVEEMIRFLRGENRQLLHRLQAQMEKASGSLEFERAIKLRDQLRGIGRVLEEQHVVSDKAVDQDIFGLFREGDLCLIVILSVRAGALLGKQHFPFHGMAGESAALLSTFVSQYYEKNFIPKEILLPFAIEDQKTIEQILRVALQSAKMGKILFSPPHGSHIPSPLCGRGLGRGGFRDHPGRIGKRGKEKALLIVPARGEKKALVKMAQENARELSASVLQKMEEREEALLELQRALGLAEIPRIIECFDVSTLMGKESVASRVQFVDGKPEKRGYRHYRIRNIEGMDDFAMIAQVIERRVLRGGPMPDLIVIDGGRGQLHAALQTLQKMEIEHVAIVGLAKERVASDYRGSELVKKVDRIFLPSTASPIVLDFNSKALHLLQQLRDESHRFAITFHRQRRGKEGLRSVLDEIPGIGKARRLALLRQFGSLAAIREASLEELAATPGVSRSLAQKVWEYFRSRTQK